MGKQSIKSLYYSGFTLVVSSFALIFLSKQSGSSMFIQLNSRAGQALICVWEAKQILFQKLVHKGRSVKNYNSPIFLTFMVHNDFPRAFFHWGNTDQ